LPALLGDLTLHLSEGDRQDIISKARVYCVDYLQRCKSYAITSEVYHIIYMYNMLALFPGPPSFSMLHSGNIEKLGGGLGVT
jgi:hypothetical protein